MYAASMNDSAVSIQPCADTRTRLLESATELFAKEGYDGTGTREIATRAGCNISMISHYFGGKEGLMKEILSDWFDAEERGLRALMEADIPSAELVPGFIDLFFDLSRRHRYVTRIIQREMANIENPTAEYARERLDANFDMIVELIRRSPKLDRHGIPPKLMANMLVGMILFYLDANEVPDCESDENAKRFIRSCYS